jgi:N-acetylglucosaminylphosphatidylinositol deacetylase
VTFDEGGVSGHPNHMCTHSGVLRWYLRSKPARVTLLSLKTHGVPWKFGGLVAALVYAWLGRAAPETSVAATTDALVFGRSTAWRSLCAHASQAVWYRHLFVIFSVYRFINVFHVSSRRR